MRRDFMSQSYKMFLAQIGHDCKKHRREYIGVSQEEVAEELCMSAGNVSAFERGMNDSAVILSYYVMNGFSVKASFERYKRRMKNGI